MVKTNTENLILTARRWSLFLFFRYILIYVCLTEYAQGVYGFCFKFAQN